MLMIAGIVVTSIVTGINLDPYTHERLVAVTAITGLAVLCLSALAVAGIEKQPTIVGEQDRKPAGSFRESIREVWNDPEARLLTLFIFMHR